jgi:hypothetical protein
VYNASIFLALFLLAYIDMLATPQDIHYELDKTNPHSVILIWASNMYSRINRLLRFYPLEVIIEETPHAVRYMKDLISYFETHGVTKDDLLSKRINTLYRGVDSKTIAKKRLLEKGFMSTSWDKNVAKRFAIANDKSGSILCYATNTLPTIVKYVIIDTNLAPYLKES